MNEELQAKVENIFDWNIKGWEGDTFMGEAEKLSGGRAEKRTEGDKETHKIPNVLWKTIHTEIYWIEPPIHSQSFPSPSLKMCKK